MNFIYISKRYWWRCVDELTLVDLVEGSVVEVTGDDVSAADSHAEQIVHPVQQLLVRCHVVRLKSTLRFNNNHVTVILTPRLGTK